MTDRAMKINNLKRRLHNAKSRALYWSGNPSYSGRRYNPRNRSRSADLEYEIALTDVRSLIGLLEQLTGRNRRYTEPRAKLVAMFSAINKAMSGKNAC
jgi:hypothetical protein